MLVCLLLRQRSYPLRKYFCVSAIVAGVVLFVFNPNKAGSGSEMGLGSGEMLILVSLAMDGCVASTQENGYNGRL